MEIQVVNFKAYSSGALVGFFDLELHGLTFAGCKAFRKEDRLWFAFPSQKVTGASGEAHYTPIITASTATMREVQDAARPHLRACLGIDQLVQNVLIANIGPEESRPPTRPAARGGGEHAYQASRRAAQDPDGEDIPF